jgi:hypothetical protein
MMPREQKITPDALARLFQDRYASSAEAAGLEQWNRPKPWAEIPPQRQMLLVDVFRQLQGLFLDDPEPDDLFVSSIVSYKTHKGMVQIKLGSLGGQVSQEQARVIAQQILDAAEAAETESMIYEILGGFDNPENELNAVRFVAAIRTMRDRRKAPVQPLPPAEPKPESQPKPE